MYYKIEKPRGQTLKIKQHGFGQKMARYGYPRAMGADTRRRGTGTGVATRDLALVLDAGTFSTYPGRHILRGNLRRMGRVNAKGEEQSGLGAFQGVIHVCHRNDYKVS